MKKLKLLATLRDIAGTREITVPFQDGQTVRQLIRDISALNPELGAQIIDENGEMTGLVHVLVHGRNVQWLNGLDTTIGERDELVLMPPTAGG